jgi:hypothetical protein
MGQPITVEASRADEFCVFTIDRSLTGQDGASYKSADEAAAGSGFPAELAGRLFGSDEAIDHVYVASNDVVVRRAADWDEVSIESAAGTIADLFRYYPD